MKINININSILLIMIALSAEAEEKALLYSGDIRVGVQYHDRSGSASGRDFALGGNLHVETLPLSGIALGATLHTTNSLSNQHDAMGVPFYSTLAASYAILSEAYIEAHYAKSSFILGRQTLDTPFLDSDDIGMIPNRFEAFTVIDEEIKDMRIVYSYVQSMSGVDADIPEEFTKINGGSGVHIVGLNYAPLADVALSGWFYHIPEFAKLYYLDGGYKGTFKAYNYRVGAQVAVEDFQEGESAKIFGLRARIEHQKSALSCSFAYNKSVDRAAVNGFGGGPFFANDEHMTLADVGADGEIYSYALEWDTSVVWSKNLLLGISHAQLKDAKSNKGEETDIFASYSANDRLTFDAIYSTLNNSKISGDKFENVRVFVNYSF